MKYRPEIDGLRSVAVLPVILFHGGVEVFSGGFVGVDVFFVISGYLITTIIARKIDDGSFSLMDFYNRRARRILPALAFVVVCCIPFAWLWMLPTDFKDFAQSVSAVSLFSSNFLFWLESGYFAAAAESKPLLHTWSLAVEEQYYILFPLLMMLFWRRIRTGTVALLGAIFLASLAASHVMANRAPDANFYLLPTRAWELMAGSLCAIWLLRRTPRTNGPAALLGLSLILGAIFVYDHTVPFPSFYALAPVGGTALIILFATRETLVGRILSHPAPVGIGLISYSAYLWHQPLFAFARIRVGHEPDIVLMMTLAAMSLALAWFSWRFVEQPARRGAGVPWKVVAGAGAGSLAVFVMGIGLGYSGLHQRYFIDTLPVQNQALLSRINRMKTMNHFVAEDDGPCRFYVERYDARSDTRFADCAETHGPAVVVFGDSHSIDVYKGLITAADYPFLVGLPQEDCRPHVMGSDCIQTSLPRFLDTHAERIHTAFYVQAGFWLLTDAAGNERARRLFNDGSDIDARINRAAVDRALAVLREWNSRVRTVWIGPRLEPHVGAEEMLGTACDRAPDLLRLRPAHVEIFARLDAYLEAASIDAGLQYISEISAVGFDVSRDLYTCDALYWSDGDHWSPAGEARFGARLAPAVDAVLAKGRVDG